MLVTTRMNLRPLEATDQDRDRLWSLDQDPEVMRYLTGGKPSTAAEVEQTVADNLDFRWLGFLTDGPDECPDTERDRFVGWFGLSPGPNPGDRQLGYRLRRPMWGAGLATEGSLAVIEHGFNAVGANRIWAQTMAVNHRSRAVMERCGLRYVRTFHPHFEDPIPGTEHGEVEYEIRAEDWPR